MVKYNTELGGLKITESDYKRFEKREDVNGNIYYLLPAKFKKNILTKPEFLENIARLFLDGNSKQEIAQEMKITLKSLDGFLTRKLGSCSVNIITEKFKELLKENILPAL